MPTVILDIEGTVCPISFVQAVLFPYFMEQATYYLNDISYPVNAEENELAKVISGFPPEHLKYKSSVLSHVRDLVANDIKDPTLKAFQGIVWKKGYESGEIKAPVYPDAIELIQSPQYKKYIYSSGSIAAQKLLFEHVDMGGELKDLTPHISGYFDITTAGHKQEKKSYEKIVQEIGEPAEDLTFYTDVPGEAQAAIDAGLKAVIVIRPGNKLLTDEEKQKFDTTESFD